TAENGPLFTFRETYAEVTLVNESAKDVIVNNVNVVNTTPLTPEHEVVLDVDDTAGFQFNVNHEFKPTLVTVRNTDTALGSTPDIVFGGVVNNPIGISKIFNAQGNIISASGLVRTDSFAITAQNGAIGVNDAGRLRLEIV